VSDPADEVISRPIKATTKLKMESNKVSSKFNRTDKLNDSQMPSVEPPRSAESISGTVASQMHPMEPPQSAESTSMTNINQMHPVDRPSRYIVVSLQGVAGNLCSVAAVAWCAISSSKLFITAFNMEHQQLLVAYPCSLLYAVFALITMF
jgi:hypothetical protein